MHDLGTYGDDAESEADDDLPTVDMDKFEAAVHAEQVFDRAAFAELPELEASSGESEPDLPAAAPGRRSPSSPPPLLPLQEASTSGRFAEATGPMHSGDDSSSMGELPDLGWASGNDSDASSSTFNSVDSDADLTTRPRRRHLGHRLESLRLPPEFTLNMNAPVFEQVLAGFKTVDGRLSDRAVVKRFNDHVRQYGPQAEPLRVLVKSDRGHALVVLIKWRKTYRNYAEMFAAHGAALVPPEWLEDKGLKPCSPSKPADCQRIQRFFEREFNQGRRLPMDIKGFVSALGVEPEGRTFPPKRLTDNPRGSPPR